MITDNDIKKLAKIFATKNDLKRYPTKTDLKNELSKYATKEDLKNELRKYTTKEDLKQTTVEIIDILMEAINNIDSKLNTIIHKYDDIHDITENHELRITKIEDRLYENYKHV